MGRRPAFGMLVLVAAIVIPAGGPAWAAKAPAKATQDAAVSTLLEDLDGLNAKVNSQAQEIDALKKRVSEAEARQADGMAGLESRLAPRAELEPVRQDVATIRKDVDGLRNRADAWFHPSLELRVRPEYKVNHRDLDSDIADGDFFVRQRTRLGLSFKPVAWVEAVLMIQDMRCWGQEVSTKSNEKNLDLFQGYVRLSDLFVPGLSVQLGRMEMAFGAERQVSRNNFTAGRAFDGVRIAYDRPQVIRADLFATVVKDAGVPAGHDVNFYGLYLASNAWSFLDAELYGMYLENGTEGAAEFIGTVGGACRGPSDHRIADRRRGGPAVRNPGPDDLRWFAVARGSSGDRVCSAGSVRDSRDHPSDAGSGFLQRVRGCRPERPPKRRLPTAVQYPAFDSGPHGLL